MCARTAGLHAVCARVCPCQTSTFEQCVVLGGKSFASERSRFSTARDMDVVMMVTVVMVVMVVYVVTVVVAGVVNAHDVHGHGGCCL